MPFERGVDGQDIKPASVETDSTATKTIGAGNYHFAGDYDGTDADARLSNAVTAANEGDTIFLESAEYTASLTVNKRLRLVGTGGLSGGVSGDGTFINNTTWTFDDRVKLVGAGIDATIVLNDTLCALTECAVNGNAPININANNCRYVNNHGGDVTFDTGTSGGLVDACTGTTTTDNGTNTVGDTS